MNEWVGKGKRWRHPCPVKVSWHQCSQRAFALSSSLTCRFNNNWPVSSHHTDWGEGLIAQIKLSNCLESCRPLSLYELRVIGRERRFTFYDIWRLKGCGSSKVKFCRHFLNALTVIRRASCLMICQLSWHKSPRNINKELWPLTHERPHKRSKFWAKSTEPLVIIMLSGGANRGQEVNKKKEGRERETVGNHWNEE